MRGIDFAWGKTPSPGVLKADGVGFVVRYLSYDPSKNLTASELQAMNAAGIGVCVVWESTAGRMLGGHTAGAQDAAEADRQARALGMAGIPLYFACDFDTSVLTGGQWQVVDAYVDAVAAVIGRDRTGGYGGLGLVRHLFDTRRITWGWQTYAWSKRQWDPRAQLRQIQNGVKLVGIPGLEVDLDDAMVPDFGQWPRPAEPAHLPVPAMTRVPNVTGKSAAAAHNALHAARLTHQGGIDGACIVTAVKPSAGAVLTAGSAVRLSAAAPPVLRRDAGLAVSEWVKLLQHDLNKAGLGVGEDGRFGDQTERATGIFQSREGLRSDGVAGRLTWAALGKL